MRQLLDFKGDCSTLSEADRFMVQLVKVPWWVYTATERQIHTYTTVQRAPSMLSNLHSTAHVFSPSPGIDYQYKTVDL